MSLSTDDPFPNLIISYDRFAEVRDTLDISDWKRELRRDFLSTLESENKSKLIDIGAGTGVHGKFFQDHGIEVTCIDISPALIDKCKEKGLNCYLANILENTRIDQLYDSAFALNSLLHIPTTQLLLALSNISEHLEPDGLLYWGQYGGEYREGIYQEDHYQPKRFFSLLDDQQMQDFALKYFSIERFDQIKLENLSPLHFQSMLLRKKQALVP